MKKMELRMKMVNSDIEIESHTNLNIADKYSTALL